MTSLVRDVSLRKLPELFGPQKKFVGPLAAGEDALAWRDTLATIRVRVLHVEAMAACGHVPAQVLIGAIPYLEMSCVRLGFHVVCRDKCRNPLEIREEALMLRRSVGHRMYDETA